MLLVTALHVGNFRKLRSREASLARSRPGLVGFAAVVDVVVSVLTYIFEMASPAGPRILGESAQSAGGRWWTRLEGKVPSPGGTRRQLQVSFWQRRLSSAGDFGVDRDLVKKAASDDAKRKRIAFQKFDPEKRQATTAKATAKKAASRAKAREESERVPLHFNVADRDVTKEQIDAVIDALYKNEGDARAAVLQLQRARWIGATVDEAELLARVGRLPGGSHHLVQLERLKARAAAAEPPPAAHPQLAWVQGARSRAI